MNTFTVRHLLSLAIFAAVGAGIYFGSPQVAPQLDQAANIGIAVIAGLVCSIAFAFLTRPRIGSTSGTTNSAQAPRPAARSTGGSGGKNGSGARSGGGLPHLPQRTEVAAQLLGTAPKQRQEPKPRTVENATFTIGDVEGKKVVTVKVSGITGGQFKKNGGAHDRIIGVSGVKWAHPKNDQVNKACTVSGVVNGNAEASVRAALEKLGITASA